MPQKIKHELVWWDLADHFRDPYKYHEKMGTSKHLLASLLGTWRLRQYQVYCNKSIVASPSQQATAVGLASRKPHKDSIWGWFAASIDGDGGVDHITYLFIWFSYNSMNFHKTNQCHLAQPHDSRGEISHATRTRGPWRLPAETALEKSWM